MCGLVQELRIALLSGRTLTMKYLTLIWTLMKEISSLSLLFTDTFVVALSWAADLRVDGKGPMSSSLAISPEKWGAERCPLAACLGTREICILETCHSVIPQTANSLTSTHEAVISFSAVALVICDTFSRGKQHHRCMLHFIGVIYSLYLQHTYSLWQSIM